MDVVEDVICILHTLVVPVVAVVVVVVVVVVVTVVVHHSTCSMHTTPHDHHQYYTYIILAKFNIPLLRFCCIISFTASVILGFRRSSLHVLQQQPFYTYRDLRNWCVVFRETFVIIELTKQASKRCKLSTLLVSNKTTCFS